MGQYEEYTVVRILKHPGMSTTILSDNIAILYTDRDININHPYVNTACLPSCDNQFDYIFSNGTGVRCHVAGWGKDEADGSFQFIPKKVDLSLMPADQCEARLSLGDGQLLVSCPGALDALLIYLECMSRCLTTENGSILIKILINLIKHKNKVDLVVIISCCK